MVRICALLVLAAGAMANPKMALLESSAEEVLANTVVNEISTHEWSMSAKNLPGPSIDLEKGAPQVEAWYIDTTSPNPQDL